MNNKKGFIIWVGIISTALYIIVTLLVFFSLPYNSFYFCGHIFRCCNIHLIWLILSFAACVVQIVLITYLVFFYRNNDNNFKRDQIATTVIGIVCFIACMLTILPCTIAFAFDELFDEPKCYEYSNGENAIIIRQYCELFSVENEVWFLNDDCSVKKLGYLNNDVSENDFVIVWSQDSVTVLYDSDSGDSGQKKFELPTTNQK